MLKVWVLPDDPDPTKQKIVKSVAWKGDDVS